MISYLMNTNQEHTIRSSFLIVYFASFFMAKIELQKHSCFLKSAAQRNDWAFALHVAADDDLSVLFLFFFIL